MSFKTPPPHRHAIILKSTESTTFTPLRNPQIMTFIYLVYWCVAQCPTALGRQDLVSTHLFIYRFALLGQFRAGALVITNSLIALTFTQMQYPIKLMVYKRSRVSFYYFLN